jgi:tetratricopeptide (TPR) repeat protein
MVHPLVASTLHNIGVVLLFAGRFDDAFTYFQQAVSIRTSTFGTDRTEASASMMKFGLLQLSKRQFQSALQTFTNALHILRKVHGYYHPLTVKVLNNIACAHFECGGLVAATKAVEEAIEILRRTSTANNDASLALSILLSNQGFLLSKRGLNTEASEAYREAANIQKDLLAHDDSSLVMTKKNLVITEARAESNQHRKPRRLPVSCNLTYEDYECAI